MGFHPTAMTLAIAVKDFQCIQACPLIVAIHFPFPFDPPALLDLSSDLPLATGLFPDREDQRGPRRLRLPKWKLLLDSLVM